jgi:hypothetical protein
MRACFIKCAGPNTNVARRASEATAYCQNTYESRQPRGCMSRNVALRRAAKRIRMPGLVLAVSDGYLVVLIITTGAELAGDCGGRSD